VARSAGPRDAGREAGETSAAVGDRLRSLPSVEELAVRLHDLPHAVRVRAVRDVIDRRRRAIADGSDPDPVDPDALEASARERALAELRPRLRPVLNATGVIVHTNLGRVPLAERAIHAVEAVARGYSNLEYDLDAGARGSRNAHVEGALRDVTGAAAATVVNNCAAAVLLAAAALAAGGEIVVSRGQLIEIGGSFRIPDVVAQSGARLVEVGTTNRTRPRDYERAIGPDTGAVLRVHPSNFRALGFTEEVAIEDLCELAGRAGVPVIDDAGSGALAGGVGELADEPAIPRSVRAGCALVCFSGDKLLGGPQAGVIVGGEDAVERCRRHPLARALRPDKMQLAALEATLAVYRESAQADGELPVLRMLTAGDAELRPRAEAMVAILRDRGVEAQLATASSKAGGGALPLLELEGPACEVEPAATGLEELARRLRAGAPPVVGRVRDGSLLLDPRTLTDAEARQAAEAVAAVLV
jgi:L-seryl-tRNA(Ser) seleniumtransferase